MSTATKGVFPASRIHNSLVFTFASRRIYPMGTLYRRKEGGNWQAEFTDATGARKQKSTGTKSKTAAAKILSKWEADASSALHGLTSQEQSLATLLGQYRDYLTGDDPKHINATINNLTRIFTANDWTKVQQITQSKSKRQFASSESPTAICYRFAAREPI